MTLPPRVTGAPTVDLEASRAIAAANLAHVFGVVTPRGGAVTGVLQRGAVRAFATGSSAAFFNPVLALEPGSRAADVEAAVAWVESRGLPASIQVREDLDPRILDAAVSLGFEAEAWRIPVMVLDRIPREAPPAPAGVAIRIGGVEIGNDMHDAISSGPGYRALFGPGVMANPEVRMAVAYLDGEPVAAATAMRGAGAIGIYAVGTRERARRRGIGRAVTWAAILAGAQAWGDRVAILQSSEPGEPVYRSMGFEAVTRYVYLERPGPGPAGG